MPATPFHFGPGAALKALLPRYFSFTVFCLAQVVTDCEVAYYLLRGKYHVHRWCHTYLGATAVALGCALLGRPLCDSVLRQWHSRPGAPFRRYLLLFDPTGGPITIRSALAGAFLGTYSHVFLDSIMHSDIQPFRPFSDANALHGLIGLLPLHLLCVAAGVLGAGYLAFRASDRSGPR